MNVGDVIVLSAKTHKGKNLLKKNGNNWIIHTISGPKLLIYGVLDKPSLDLPGSSRWILKENDFDFEIIRNLGQFWT